MRRGNGKLTLGHNRKRRRVDGRHPDAGLEGPEQRVHQRVEVDILLRIVVERELAVVAGTMSDSSQPNIQWVCAIIK